MYERTIGGAEQGQPEYMPLYCLCAADGRVMSRWKLSDSERIFIANGADIFLSIWCGGAYPPTMIEICTANRDSNMIKQDLRLDDEMELRMLQQAMLDRAEDFNRAKEAFEAKYNSVHPNKPNEKAKY